jgi:hypothetical protein
VVVIPFLMRTLFGMETAFTLSGQHLMNTTFAAVVWGMTYLCINPLVKAVYVLRCFYGEALKSGADLKADLKSFRRKISTTSAAVLTIAILVSGIAPMAIASDVSIQETVSPEKLDHEIGKIIQKREYQWRIPKERNPQNEIDRNVALEFIQGFYRWFVRWWNAFNEWFNGLFPDSKGKGKSGSEKDLLSQKQLWYFLAGAGIVILAGVLWILWRRKAKKSGAVIAEPLPSIPNLTDENVLANQLPEEEWQSLARDFLLRGELRLALRALFLATLAGLSRQELISIAKFKSNLDYQKELTRRARSRIELQHLFSENISVFERSWYGMHEVNSQMLNKFGENQNRISQLAQK